MPVTVVVGGQFGSEGKGKVAHFLAKEMNASVAIRCGGPNSGHTVIDPHGKPLIFQQLPTASILPDIKIVLCAGSYIDLSILKKEIQISKLNAERLLIDPNAVIITPDLIKAEEKEGLIETIGSTGSGTGEAVMRRVKRGEKILFAKDEPSLSNFIEDTTLFLRKQLGKNNRIILEGTQGFGLSVIHSPFYPYVTSRDTTASAFLSEAGLSPLDVDDVILTIRAFPIRVNGNSGPLANEIDWFTVTKESGSNRNILEFTSVSKKLRRVARFEPEIVCKAIGVNKPSRIVLNHLDYIDSSFRKSKNLSIELFKFIKDIEKSINNSIDFLGFGPDLLLPKSFLFPSNLIKAIF